MKRLVAQLTAGYASLGALAFLMHRARYLASGQIRDFTDRRSHELLQELDTLRDELHLVRRQLHAVNRKAPPGEGEASRSAAIAA